MNELAIPEADRRELAARYAQEARVYSASMAVSGLQLGRVLNEAKKVVPHGEWTAWVAENAGMNIRQAQCLMGAYTRFGQNAMLEGVEKSKVFAMLALPEGAEDKFLEENNVRKMTAREVGEAVRQAKAEADAEYRKKLEEKESTARDERAKLLRELEAEKSARTIAESLAKKAEESREPDEETLNELNRLRDENERYREVNGDLMKEKNRLITERNSAENSKNSSEDTLKELSEENKRLKQQLHEAKRAAASGDAERAVSGELSADDIVQAFRQFYGIVGTAAQMGHRLAGWSAKERRSVTEILRTLDAWMRDTSKALNTVTEGAIENV